MCAAEAGTLRRTYSNMDTISPQQTLMNTVTRCFGRHFEDEALLSAVVHADGGARDFQLITDVIWEMLPEV